MYRKNTASQFIAFQGVDATTGGIKSGVTWTIRRCIDGTFAAATGTATEDGTTGWYKFAMSQADTNGNNIEFNFTGTGAVPQTVNILTDGSPPDINVKTWISGAIPAVNVTGVPLVDLKYTLGTISPAAAGSVRADSGTAAALVSAIWQDATAGDFTVGGTIGKSIMQGVALGTGINVNVDTIKTNPVVNGGTITFPTNATLASTTNVTAGTITTVTNLTNAPTAGDFTATMKTSAQTAADAAITANALVLEIEADTDTLTGFVTAAPPTANANADALLARNIAGGSSSGRIVTDALRFLRNKWSVSGTTLTVTQEDDTTSAWTATISTDAAALPITGSDPA